MMEKRGFPHHFVKLHRLRKRKELGLPVWKYKWNEFNEKYFHWLEKTVDFLIPWLVLLLFAIILAELGHYLPFEWAHKVSAFMEKNEKAVSIIDQVIIAFFIIDLYFNFFKKRTVWKFVQTSFLDIIAIAPLSTIFDLAGLAEIQKVLHVEQETTKIIKEGELTSKLLKAEEFAKFARLQRSARAIEFFAKIPRFFRLNRLRDFFRKKE